MESAIKLLSQEFKTNLEQAIETGAFKDVIAATKAADDSGTFEVVISTADMDRSGEIVDQSGWNLELYKMNPVVLWGHDYYSLPIGVCDSIELIEGKLIAKGRFAPADANPFAQQVRKLYDAQIVRATSVGFIVSKMDGNTIIQAELLEFSFVPVPANPYALSLRDAETLGLNTMMLSMKGLNNLIKKEEGDQPPMPTDTPSEPTPEETPAEDPTPEETPTETPAEEAAPEETPSDPAPAEQKAINTKADEELTQQIGAELAAIQATVDAAITDGVRRIMEILKPTNGGDEENDDAEKSADENDAGIPEDAGIEPEQEQAEDPAPAETKDFEDFQTNRLILRALATATTNALENYNKKSRKHEQRRISK